MVVAVETGFQAASIYLDAQTTGTLLEALPQ